MRYVLNPTLYAALERRFGNIRVANEGQSCFMVPEYTVSGQVYFRYKGGEYYRVHCPWCGDLRHRLYFSHMWGVRDEHGQHKDLVICYHQNCVGDSAFRDLLWMEIYSGFPVTYGQQVSKGIDVQNVPYTAPGRISRLERLSPEHPAVQYVAGRGYDPVELSQTYGIGYVEEAFYEFAIMQHRLFIPVTFRGQPRGWQGRLLTDEKDDAKTPKYFNWYAFHKSEHLYNFDAAKDYRVVVLVEGVTNVWRFGPQAVACFGSSVSSTQQTLLAEMVGTDGVCVLLFDGDTWEIDENRTESKAATAIRSLSAKLPGRLVPIRLPPGVDPARYSRPELHAMVSGELERAGFVIPLGEVRSKIVRIAPRIVIPPAALGA